MFNKSVSAYCMHPALNLQSILFDIFFHLNAFANEKLKQKKTIMFFQLSQIVIEGPS